MKIVLMDHATGQNREGLKKGQGGQEHRQRLVPRDMGSKPPKEAKNLMRVTGSAVGQRWRTVVKVPQTGQTLKKG